MDLNRVKGCPVAVWRRLFQKEQQVQSPGVWLCLAVDLTQNRSSGGRTWIALGAGGGGSKGLQNPHPAPSYCKGYCGKRVTRVLVTLGKSLGLSGL